jgi:hypothetical protein
LTWVAATFVAVFVALQAVGAVGRQVTDRPAAVARRDAATTTTSPSAAPPSSAVTSSTTTSTPPGGITAETVPATGGGPGPTTATQPPSEPQSSEPQPQPEPELEQESTSSSPAETEPAPLPGPTTTYNLEGGSIGVRCTGSTIELVYSSPAPGFSTEVDHSGPEEVDVRFENDDHRSRIKVQCSGGNPVVESREEED